MKYRTAVNLQNPKIKFKCYKVHVHITGWEWFLTFTSVKQYKKDAKDNISDCFVQSPMCPEGEFGSLYIDELAKMHSGTPDESLPPQGWQWEDQLAKKVA